MLSTENVKKSKVSQEEIRITPPYPVHLYERVPQLHIFRLALSLQEKPGLFSQPLMAAECGVYRGYSLLAFAKIARELKFRVHFYGLDSFEGFPELSEKDKLLAPEGSRYLNKRLFTDTGLTEVHKLFKEHRLSNCVTFCKGFFSKTLPTLPEKKYFFVNVDCDLYEPHLEVLDYFYPRLVRNGVIFFDDYYSQAYPMAKSAIDTFVKKNDLKLFHFRYGEDTPNCTKTFIVKE